MTNEVVVISPRSTRAIRTPTASQLAELDQLEYLFREKNTPAGSNIHRVHHKFESTNNQSLVNCVVVSTIDAKKQNPLQ